MDFCTPSKESIGSLKLFNIKTRTYRFTTKIFLFWNDVCVELCLIQLDTPNLSEFTNFSLLNCLLSNDFVPLSHDHLDIDNDAFNIKIGDLMICKIEHFLQARTNWKDSTRNIYIGTNMSHMINISRTMNCISYYDCSSATKKCFNKLTPRGPFDVYGSIGLSSTFHKLSSLGELRFSIFNCVSVSGKVVELNPSLSILEYIIKSAASDLDSSNNPWINFTNGFDVYYGQEYYKVGINTIFNDVKDNLERDSQQFYKYGYGTYKFNNNLYFCRFDNRLLFLLSAIHRSIEASVFDNGVQLIYRMINSYLYYRGVELLHEDFDNYNLMDILFTLEQLKVMCPNYNWKLRTIERFIKTVTDFVNQMFVVMQVHKKFNKHISFHDKLLVSLNEQKCRLIDRCGVTYKQWKFQRPNFHVKVNFALSKTIDYNYYVIKTHLVDEVEMELEPEPESRYCCIKRFHYYSAPAKYLYPKYVLQPLTGSESMRIPFSYNYVRANIKMADGSDSITQIEQFDFSANIPQRDVNGHIIFSEAIQQDMTRKEEIRKLREQQQEENRRHQQLIIDNEAKKAKLELQIKINEFNALKNKAIEGKKQAKLSSALLDEKKQNKQSHSNSQSWVPKQDRHTDSDLEEKRDK